MSFPFQRFDEPDHRHVGRRWWHKVKSLQSNLVGRDSRLPSSRPSFSPKPFPLQLKQRVSAPRGNTFKLETLEPRVLLSADSLSYLAQPDASMDLTLHLVEQEGVPLLQLLENADSKTPVIMERALAETSEVVISGSDFDDLLTLDFGLGYDLSSLVITFDGGDGSDTLAGSASQSAWDITGINAGTIDDHVGFRNVENLSGAANNEDIFIVNPGGLLDGVLDGGAGGFDTLEISGGQYDTATFGASGPNSGVVLLDGNAIHYDGLAPIVLDSTVSDIELDFGLLALESDDNATLTRTDDLFTFQSADTPNTFESVTFNTGFNSLLIDLGMGTDTLSIDAILSMTGNFSATAESVTIAETASITSTAGDISITAAADVDTGLNAAIVVAGDLDAAGDITIGASVDISDSQDELGDYAYSARATADVSAASISAGDNLSINASTSGLYSVDVTSQSALDDGDASVTGTHTTRAAVAGGVSVTAGGAVDVAADDAGVVQINLVPASNETGLGAVLDLSDASSTIDLTRGVTASVGDDTNGTASIGGPSGTSAGATSVTASIADDATNGGIVGNIDSNLYGRHETTAADTVTASVTDTSAIVDSLAVSASNAATYTTTAKVANNVVTGGTSASINASTVTASSDAGVSVSASDTAQLTATSIDFELDVSVLTVPLELGSATAVNDIVRSTTASIDAASDIGVTTGGVAVSASSAITVVAFADAQILDEPGISFDPVELTFNGTI
ncbi:MAG: LEPR-XLL domain-containing protein, partial [Gammaproteobacteria bacterium]|nr:LEPR-XLL domain-containing protein [Gammaproteobacteria bacterium]